MPRYAIELDDQDVELLQELITGEWRVADDIASLAEHFMRHAADGVRRPGSWERDWITQATGYSGVGSLSTPRR